MKKVTIFSLHLGYGGIEKCVVNLANLLCDSYDVEIIATYKLDDTPAFDIDERVKVKYLITKFKPNRDEWKQSVKKLRPIKFIKESFNAAIVLFSRRNKTVNAIKKCNSDIIISTRSLFNKWVGEYGKGKAYKIAWEHNHHHNNIEYAKKLVNSCKKMDSLVLVSDSLRNYYKKQMKELNYKCKCVFIPNMLDDIPNKVSSLDEKRFVSVGRLSKEKGYTDLVEVFKRFKDRNPKEKWHLDIIGDGSEKNKIVDLIYRYDLVSDVTVHGYLKKKEINKILDKSSIYLMTSYTESFGIVLIEAFSFGIPAIAFTSAEGANDLITNDFNGYLIENRDFDKMVEKMELLVNDKNRRIDLGKNAREFCLNYSSDNIKEKWLNLLKRKV